MKGGMCINVNALYEALAKVLEQRENVKIKIRVERKQGNEEND